MRKKWLRHYLYNDVFEMFLINDYFHDYYYYAIFASVFCRLVSSHFNIMCMCEFIHSKLAIGTE